MVVRKADIVKMLKKDCKVKIKDGNVIVDKIFDYILSNLAENNEIAISGFGIFEATKTDAKTVRNPQTGEVKTFPVYVKPKFTFSEGVRIAFRDNEQSKYIVKFKEDTSDGSDECKNSENF